MATFIARLLPKGDAEGNQIAVTWESSGAIRSPVGVTKLLFWRADVRYRCPASHRVR
jgi:hypothetical protein